MQLKFGDHLLAFCSNICDSFFLSQNRKRIQSDPYLYDAFVSYSSEDEAWVRDELVGGTGLGLVMGDTPAGVTICNRSSSLRGKAFVSEDVVF